MKRVKAAQGSQAIARLNGVQTDGTVAHTILSCCLSEREMLEHPRGRQPLCSFRTETAADELIQTVAGAQEHSCDEEAQHCSHFCEADR